jgi:ABC-2 type transport system permease protein
MSYVYPIIIGQGALEGRSSSQPIKVTFSYNENSKEGQFLTSILNESSVKDYIASDNSNNAQWKASFSKDFDSITLEKLKGSDDQIDIVKSFIATFTDNMNQYKIMTDDVNKLQLSNKNKQKLISKLESMLEKNSRRPLIKEQLIQGYKTIGTGEYFIISMFSFTSILILSIISKGFYKDKKQGVVRRSFSTPNSKANYLMGYLSSSSILFLVINISYVIINKLLGIAFLNQFMGVLVTVLFQSLLQTAIMAVIISFIAEERSANGVLLLLVILSAVLGGVFYNPILIPIDFIKEFSNILPNTLILNCYKNLSIQQGLGGVLPQMLSMGLVSAVLLIASFVKVKVRWEG